MCGVPADFQEAVRWIYQAAVQGNADAENQLGLALWFGNGAPQDEAAAVTWFERSADQGHVEAMYNLGTHYYRRYRWSDDRDKFRSMEKSTSLFIQAAKGGHPWAQRAAGNAYAQGAGVPPNREMAMFWYLKALQNGVYDAKQNIAAL